MWLLNASTYELEEFHGDDKPEYVILSHTWETGEVSFANVQDAAHDTLRGWSKIRSCCKQALVDDYAWIWADTCCIDRRNLVDLSEAINSMFRWYREAAVCYTYLSDVSVCGDDESLIRPSSSSSIDSSLEQSDTVLEDNSTRFDGATRSHDDHDLDKQNSTGSLIVGSRWFTRGWTLQELLAPKSLVFYDTSWIALGTRVDYLSHIEGRTNIPSEALREFVPEDYCIAQKIAWAAGRRTTRPGDRAYSLLGLLGVSLSLVYGEGGEEAFYRLQRKLIKRLDDTSILTWNRRVDSNHSNWLLASSPDAFEGCYIFREYQSCATGLELNKTALVGNFYTRIHCLSYACACLGHFQRCLKDKLPPNFSDERDPSGVNTVGMLLIESLKNTYEPIMLDGKRHLLSDHPQHGRNSFHWQKLSISSVPPELHPCSSVEAADSQYPRRDQRKISTLISPGKFWPGIDQGDRESRLSRPISSIRHFKQSRVLYAPPARNTNEPLFINRGREELNCFVISRPSSSDKGKVIQFGYDFTDCPTIREGQLRERLSSNISMIGIVQHIDTTKGLVEVASRRPANDYLGLNASISTAKQWAETSEFDHLGESKTKDCSLLPQETHVVKLGDNIKIVFLPQDMGHRVLLAFRGSFDDIHSVPRAWLWPMQETEAVSDKSGEHKKEHKSFTTRLRAFFKRD